MPSITVKQALYAKLKSQSLVLNALLPLLEHLGYAMSICDNQGRFCQQNELSENIAACQGDVTFEDWEKAYGPWYNLSGDPIPPKDLPVARVIRGEEEFILGEKMIAHGRVLEISVMTLYDKGQRIGALILFFAIGEA